MAKLKDKVAFLTGAGAGIAKATAKLFVAEGAKVAIIEMNREVGDAAEKEIRAAGGDALFIETDVTKDDSMKRAMDASSTLFLTARAARCRKTCRCMKWIWRCGTTPST